jgi:rSAM/selenodomain-associated transferase 1
MTTTAPTTLAAPRLHTADVALIVLAKAPVPGRVKTRLCPPFTPEQAAVVAAAALVDTLAAVRAVRSHHRVLVLDPGPRSADQRPLAAMRGIALLAQRGDGLDERLAAAFADVGGPALLVGMDTPQATPALLQRCLERLGRPGVDAVLGDAIDGGFWAIGLRSPDPAAFLGVPMSTAATGAAQRRRLQDLGLRVEALPVLRDVDTAVDARLVAAAAPGTRFAAAVRRVLGDDPRLEPEPS